MLWWRASNGDGIRKRPARCSGHTRIPDPMSRLHQMPERANPRDTAATARVRFAAPKKLRFKHEEIHSGDRCPDCGRGNVYLQKEPRTLVRIVGQAPLAATVYELERLRCNAYGQVFTAQEPEGVGPEKYDETAAAMIAQLKYGSGVPFNRLEQMEELLGIPLPAATQWGVVEEAAEVMRPARHELIRQAAQDEVLYSDDTGMRVLKLSREPSDERTGVFTTGIVSTAAGRKIALYFTGRQQKRAADKSIVWKARTNCPSISKPRLVPWA
jgi:transposase